jgi:hypothetical protein
MGISVKGETVGVAEGEFSLADTAFGTQDVLAAMGARDGEKMLRGINTRLFKYKVDGLTGAVELFSEGDHGYELLVGTDYGDTILFG